MSIINIENGDFSLGADMIISSNTEYDEVFGFKIDKTATDLGNGSEWISIRNFKIDDLYFFFNLHFYEKKLKMIHFSFSDNFVKDTSWDSWNIDEEKKNKKKFDDWLNASVSNLRKFNWGEISVNFDKKEGFTSILVLYK